VEKISSDLIPCSPPMDWFLILYFLAGVLQDFLVTLNLRYINQDKLLSAMSSSFIATVVSLIVLYNLITSLDPNKSVIAIIIYALGVAFGTFLGMKFKHGFKK